MAEVPITINGVICDLYGRTITGPVKIVGSAVITGLGVGGGPIIPPDGGGSPPGIWGPTDPRPTPPIPIYPGGTPNPPGIWGPTDPRPSNPIANVPGIDNPDAPKPPKPPDSTPPGGGEAGSPDAPVESPPVLDEGTGFWKQIYVPSLAAWVWVWIPYPQP